MSTIPISNNDYKVNSYLLHKNKECKYENY